MPILLRLALPPIAEASPGLWALLTAGLFIAAFLGFRAGISHAKSAANRSLERAKSTLAGLFAHVLGSIETAQNTCAMLESFAGLKLSLEQLERLEQKRERLIETVARIVERQQTAVAPPQPQQTAVPEIAWVRSPQHPVTRLPDRSAFDENRPMLARIAAEAGVSCGLLLVEIDRVEHLKTRFGIAGVQSFARTTAGLICRSLRDADLVCQYTGELFAVLMPGVDEAAAQNAAEDVRQTIRRHTFRLGEKGTEVLVTASFGLTVFNAEADSELAIGRAESALQRSRKEGRNKLCFDSGRDVLLCSESE